MAVPRQFMDNQCEMFVKISCEIAFLTGMVEQLHKENDELKTQLQQTTPKANGPDFKQPTKHTGINIPGMDDA